MWAASWPVTLVPPPMKPQAILVLLLVAVVATVSYFLLREGDEVAPANLPGGVAHAAKSGDTDPVTAESANGSGQAQVSSPEAGVMRTSVTGGPAGKTSAKVFKWTTVELPARGKISLTKRHPMKPTTIRALYPAAGENIMMWEKHMTGAALAHKHFRLIALHAHDHKRRSVPDWRASSWFLFGV